VSVEIPSVTQEAPLLEIPSVPSVTQAPLLEIPSVTGRTKAPLLEVFEKHGLPGLVYFALAAGCDYSPRMASGILGVGPVATCHFLLELDLLSPQVFSDKVRVEAHEGQLPAMPKAFLEEIVDGNDMDGDPMLAQYIIPVKAAYGSATYYDSGRNIHNVQTGAIKKDSTPQLVNHASGKLHPHTGLVFSEEDANCILGFDPKLRDTIHTDPKILKRHAIPNNFQELDVTALRGIIAACGGTVTHNKT
jgi:hypothetical protein